MVIIIIMKIHIFLFIIYYLYVLYHGKTHAIKIISPFSLLLSYIPLKTSEKKT